MERNPSHSLNHETAQENPRIPLVNHEMENGTKIVVFMDPFHPDELDTYHAHMEENGHKRSLEVAAAYDTADNYHRWIKCIEFTDGSSVAIEVQRFEMHYIQGRRIDFLVPCTKPAETIDL